MLRVPESWMREAEPSRYRGGALLKQAAGHRPGSPIHGGSSLCRHGVQPVADARSLTMADARGPRHDKNSQQFPAALHLYP